MTRLLLCTVFLSSLAAAVAAPPTPAKAIADASAAGDARAIAFALELGADPNALGEDGLTPLMRAAATGNFEAVRALLWQGARADRANSTGKTALDLSPAPTFKDDDSTAEGLRRYLVQILLRGYARLDRHGERGSAAQPVTRPSLVLLDTPAVDLRAPALARAVAVNTAEAGGVPGQDDDENGFVDDVVGWRAQPSSPWANEPAFDTIFTSQKDAAAQLLAAYSAAQLGGLAEKTALQKLELALSDPKKNAPGLSATLAMTRGTHLAGLVLEASGQQARLQFVTIPTTAPRPPSGPLCEPYLAELARVNDAPADFCDRLLEHIVTEQISIGKTLSAYVRRTGAGVVLLPPLATHGLEATVDCVREIFAGRPSPRGQLTPELLNRLRWELLVQEALPAAFMIYENPNVLFVCAAGDEARDADAALLAPAALSRFFPNAITVTSIDEKGAHSAFANFGRSSVQLAAPGEKAKGLAPAGLSWTTSSTGVSAARVAGLAASLRAAQPRVTAEDLRRLLVEAADARTSSAMAPVLNPARVREFLPGNSPAALRAHAAQLRHEGRYQAAGFAIAAALDVEKSAAGWTEKAEIEYASGEVREAIATLGKSIALEPASLPLLLRRAGWHREIGDLAGCSADYEAALTIAPGDRALATSYAQALYGGKAYRRSAQIFSDILSQAKDAQQPVPLEAYAGLTISLWSDVSTRAEATVLFRDLLALEPRFGNADWLKANGWSGDPLAALQTLKATISESSGGSRN